MKTIGSVSADESFFECIRQLTSQLGIKRVMLTGGEPTIHPQLLDIIRNIDVPDISVTTNGIRPLSSETWNILRKAGLGKVIVSIHDASPQSFLQLEVRKRNFGWAVQALEAQKNNLVAATEAGLKVRVNTVAYDSYEQVIRVLEDLGGLQQKYLFDIRLLNDLSNIERSQQVIHDVCQALCAVEVASERRAGSSNATVVWRADSGFNFSTKLAYKYFFDPVCSGCLIKENCHEGFYGVRIERRMNDYWVRLCIYKHSPDVLMPWKTFLESNVSKRFRELCESERSKI
jgi:cyclic pyranopterin phosphate synthase